MTNSSNLDHFNPFTTDRILGECVCVELLKENPHVDVQPFKDQLTAQPIKQALQSLPAAARKQAETLLQQSCFDSFLICRIQIQTDPVQMDVLKIVKIALP